MPINDNVQLGKDVYLGQADLINLYGCTIGDNTRIGAFVEIQKNVTIGCRCKISSHSFLCEGVTVGNEVFIGHGVIFTNDRFPRATTVDGRLQDDNDWQVIPTTVLDHASIGSGCTILCGVTIGSHAMIGAGSVVTVDVPPHAIVAGNPARLIGSMQNKN